MNFNQFVSTMRERPMLELERWCRAWDLDHPIGSSISFRNGTDVMHGVVARGVMVTRDVDGEWDAMIRVMHGPAQWGTAVEISIDQVVDDV